MYILFFIILVGVFCLYRESKAREDRLYQEAIQAKQELDIKRQQLWELEQKERRKAIREEQIQTLINHHSLAYSEAVTLCDILEVTNYWYDYEMSEKTEKQQEIIQKATEFHKVCTKTYLPIAKEKGLSITPELLGWRREYFESALYADIPCLIKLQMVDQWDNQQYSIKPNTKSLYRALSQTGLYLNPEDVFSNRYEPLQIDEAYRIAECFSSIFKINLTRIQLQNISEYENYEKHSPYELHKIFCYCISRERSYISYFEPYSAIYASQFPKEIVDDLADQLRYHFEQFISALFFGIVFYDINEYKSIIEAHKDYWNKEAKYICESFIETLLKNSSCEEK